MLKKLGELKIFTTPTIKIRAVNRSQQLIGWSVCEMLCLKLFPQFSSHLNATRDPYHHRCAWHAFCEALLKGSRRMPLFHQFLYINSSLFPARLGDTHHNQYRLLDSLVVECWLRVREVPGSIPSQGPRHTKDVIKMVPVVPLFGSQNKTKGNTGSFRRIKIRK